MLRRLIIVLTFPIWFCICVALFIVELFAHAAIEGFYWIKTGRKTERDGLWATEKFYHFIFSETIEQ